MRGMTVLEELKQLNPKQVIEAIFPDGSDWAIPFREVIGELTDNLDCNEIRDLIKNNISQPELPPHPNFIRVMSLHKSKGLTADIVIICGFIESLLPKRNSRWTVAESRYYIEEQRRLLFVGLTRPTAELIISSIYLLPRNLALQMGAEVVGWLPTKTRTIASSFIADLGPSFPKTITGEAFLKSFNGQAD